MVRFLAKVIFSDEAIAFFHTPVPAGFPSPAADYIGDGMDLNDLLIKTPSAAFFVKVEGGSMIEAFIPPKALLIVDTGCKPAFMV